MTIGETIRHYRKTCHLTQAQLASAIGVSVQAISKWETGAGTPDISQIVPLARALHITTDNLLHFTDRREDFEKLWHDTLERTHGEPRQMLAVSLEALAEYPEDRVFLLRAAVDAEQLASMTEERQQKEGHLRSALTYCRRLLQAVPEDRDAQLRTVRILSQLGMDEEAFALACQCSGREREFALKYCLKGESLRQHRQMIIDRKLRSLLSELCEGDSAMLDAAERMILAAIPDGNYRHYAESLANIYLKRFILHRAAGDSEASCAAARQILELAKAADSHPGRAFTAPLFDLLESINPDDRPDRAWRWLLSYVESNIPQWQTEADLAEIVNDAYAHLKQMQLL